MKHVALPSGAVAKVSSDVQPETLEALDEMMRIAAANTLPDFRTVEPAEYLEGDLEKFCGLDPDFTGELSTADYLDTIR